MKSAQTLTKLDVFGDNELAALVLGGISATASDDDDSDNEADDNGTQDTH